MGFQAGCQAMQHPKECMGPEVLRFTLFQQTWEAEVSKEKEVGRNSEALEV